MTQTRQTEEYQEAYTKDHPDVIQETLEKHQQITNEVLTIMENTGMKKKDLIQNLGSDAPYAFRLLDPTKNVTLQSLVRVAAAIGAELQIDFIKKSDTTS